MACSLLGRDIAIFYQVITDDQTLSYSIAATPGVKELHLYTNV